MKGKQICTEGLTLLQAMIPSFFVWPARVDLASTLGWWKGWILFLFCKFWGGRGDNDNGVHWMDGHGSNYRSPLPIPHFSTRTTLTSHCRLTFCFSSFQEWSWDMISQLHLPCPLFTKPKKILTSNPCFLEKKAFLKKGRKEGRQQARDGFSGCLHAEGEGVSFLKKNP